MNLALPSRRHFLRAGAAGLMLAPAMARAAADSLNGDETPPLNVETTINGKGPFRFIVDTAADRSVISSDVAEALGLARGPDVVVRGIIRDVSARSVRLQTLRVGEFEERDLTVPVLPHDWIGADGYLGVDMLDGHRVTFDFAAGTLRIAEPRGGQIPSRPLPNEIVVPASGNHGHLKMVQCRVDGVPAFAFVDTGAEVSVGNTRLFEQLARSGHTAPRNVRLTGITGGSMDGMVAPVDHVQLGEMDYSDNGLVIADLQIFELWELMDRPALFIGLSLLRHMSRFTIDYGRKELRFQFSSLMAARTSTA